VAFMLDSHDRGYKGCLMRHITGDKHRVEFSLSFPKKEIGLRNKINELISFLSNSLQGARFSSFTRFLDHT